MMAIESGSEKDDVEIEEGKVVVANASGAN
jgi:hypothetical protein